MKQVKVFVVIVGMKKMNRDFTNHPYEVMYRDLVNWAKVHKSERGPERKRDVIIPDHIEPRFDDETNKYGMYNTRLDEWCGRSEVFNRFRTEEAAVAWFKGVFQ